VFGVDNITGLLSEKVKTWNKICSDIIPGLFFCSDFSPKPIPTDIPTEVLFWYDIINVCSMVLDCVPHLFRSHSTYQNSSVNMNTTIEETKSLLEIFVNRGAISSVEETQIKDYIEAIRELRNCFCHNKIPLTFNRKRVKKGFGQQDQNWSVFSNLSETVGDAFDYEGAYAIFKSRSQSVISIIDKAVLGFCSCNDEDDDVYRWTQSIASWYLGSNDIIFRGLLYKAKLEKNFNNIRSWNDLLKCDKLKNIAAQKGVSIEDLLSGYLHDLTETIFLSHQIAAPENVLYSFFDEII
jgi:hypothetical protein